MGGEWLGPSELRIGLGCMRLADERAEDTIAAAAEAGVTVFDTARAYGDGPGTGERLLARGLRACGAHQRSRIVTKGGMTRVAEAWVPDGRAKAIRADCEASLEALDGLPIDLYLLHAPDPRTPWKTSIRALAGLLDERLIARVGLSNVNRRQLDEALELAPITAVEVALSPYDDHAWRGGLLERCAEQEIAVIAHSPLGGPRRAGRLVRSTPLVEVARARGVQPAQVALAWLLALSHNLVAIPGARRPETARSAARAAGLELEAEELTALEHAFGRFATSRARSASAGAPILTDGEVVLIMGIPGAGKTRAAEAYLARGYVRMNRDERGGGLRDLADALSRELASGASRVVLDNTYLSRAARHYVIEAAADHGVPARCIWLDTPLAQAQVNLVQRLVERFGRLPAPDELRRLARSTGGVMLPTSQMRALRELEPPASDEGFASVEVVPFKRAAHGAGVRAGVLVAAAALGQPGWERAVRAALPDAPHLVFDWRPGAARDALGACVEQVAEAVAGPVEAALCPHPAGPPSCWCRPPLPGLPLAFAHTHDIDLGTSTLIGTSSAHGTLARTLGIRYLAL